MSDREGEQISTNSHLTIDTHMIQTDRNTALFSQRDSAIKPIEPIIRREFPPWIARGEVTPGRATFAWRPIKVVRCRLRISITARREHRARLQVAAGR